MIASKSAAICVSSHLAGRQKYNDNKHGGNVKTLNQADSVHDVSDMLTTAEIRPRQFRLE
jgi:hypothetical protein